MISNDSYQRIRKDISGSRSKNRFGYEVYFGIKIIYDLYLNPGNDFFVIFDYACDIETGVNNTIEFYQVKTKEDSHYTLNDLIRIEKGKTKSIFQTLIDLDVSDDVSALHIVSNSSLHGIDSEGKTFSNVSFFTFSDVDKTFLDKINSCITWPTGIEHFEKISFIVSDLSLKEPSKTLNHHTNAFLTKLFPGAPVMISQFEDVLTKIAKTKAEYEFDALSLEETIKNKGITRSDMEAIVSAYQKEVINSSIVGINYFSTKIDLIGFSFKEKLEMKERYNLLFGKGYVEDAMKTLIEEIKKLYKSEEYDLLSDKEAVEKAANDSTNIDYAEYENDYVTRLTLAVYALIKC